MIVISLLPVFLARLLVVAACSLLLAACGTSEKDALKEMKWSYSDDGVQIQVQAAPALNQVQGQPHMLTLAVVQMEDPNGFTALTANAAKLKTLLLSDSPPQGVLSIKRIFIAPGEVRNLTLERVEKAQYIGLAAGYDHLDPARCTRLYRIGVEVDSSGIIVKSRTAVPEPLRIQLRLGPEGIQESPGSKLEPVEPTKPKAGLVPAAAPTQPNATSAASSTTSNATPSDAK
ncbi:type VI secretion system lipoprotein TssJ [Pollutimonas harenae]|uniref:Type VI secretion system lipoprotein TssJ n=1 Tax=Pollutimonas harenae TaxID=657015 RepID=A0A853GSK1_9BURK|nr:type VI secretion system lipoprotein TssJ [Pollutimonas harenae]NYT85137.1 type VI secretion system lipoprotein TssJ [Pollutimonas harenae]TEA72481.1 type VI secretion system lipoprotein TssJ [Pollutimonas harenae]